jgi:hypothetical protein
MQLKQLVRHLLMEKLKTVNIGAPAITSLTTTATGIDLGNESSIQTL